EDDGEFKMRLARGHGGVRLGSEATDYCHPVVKRVAESGQEEVLIEDEATGRTDQLPTGVVGRTRGGVCVPLQNLKINDPVRRTTPDLLGVLYLDSRKRAAAMTRLDREVLQTLAVEGATVIENARLFLITREQERIEHELTLARNIQHGLLPPRLPDTS